MLLNKIIKVEIYFLEGGSLNAIIKVIYEALS
jgi:hypothetical protein